MDLHHPVVQSVLIPLLLAAAAAGLLRRWPALAVGGAIVAATAWMTGLALPPRGLLQLLPWLLVGATGFGAVAAAAGAGGAARRRPLLAWLIPWAIASAGWLALVPWLVIGTPAAGGPDPRWQIAAGFGAAGVVLLGVLLRLRTDRADAAATLAVVAAGLGGVLLSAGSLALFQQAILVAAATAGAALWIWPRSRRTFGPGATVTVTLCLLAIAQIGHALVRPAAPALGLLLLAALAAAAVAGSLGGRSRSPGVDAARDLPVAAHVPSPIRIPLIAATLATVLAVAAIGWQASAGSPSDASPPVGAGESGPAGGSAPAADDPYLDRN